MDGEKKTIYFLVALITLLSIILLIKIKTTTKYNTELYHEIYNEYKDIFDNENIQESKDIVEENNDQITDIGPITPNSTEQGNVIGKIIIPKIEIRYPIIKETTTEYLKIAPTKYCGPDVNEVRQFSYSWS
ncbi:unknown [Clostridium sp. CAG:780]|nr:unknown [Clostridium sp. CAG:780]